MKWYEKVVTVKVTYNSSMEEFLVSDYIIHPQRNIKVKYSRINRDDLQNTPVSYNLPQDLKIQIEKSTLIRKLFQKTKFQKLENNYLRKIEACRNFLNVGMKFFKELEKIQNIKKDEKWKIKEKNLKLETK